ncbi:unnamed protein product [Prorocentrum cordatum]|uniref:Uncharacterized protein n=1 Tax=Prorocentrum cordatum TaxID=2364126 RepID=A0ABN9SKG5_9DINO|nr:unnamed protein product [Polarella glacialis]
MSVSWPRSDVCILIATIEERRVLLHGVEGEQLDTSIASLASQEPGAWPVRYGYCLVGRVEAASRLAAGSRVVCFHPHASAAVVAESDALSIPDDVGDEDAAFFPNILVTACSLVQDAAPVLGDRVAVFGAGVVGSLVAAVLCHGRQAVAVAEPRPERLRPLLAALPAAEGLACARGEWISCGTGGRRAGHLGGGRVVVGSLYGEQGAMLPLGLRFHRSEMTLVASQVSRVAAPLSTRWSKGRRAELAWEMLRPPKVSRPQRCTLGAKPVRALRPASWVPMRRHPVEQAAGVYARLAGGSPPAQLLFT